MPRHSELDVKTERPAFACDPQEKDQTTGFAMAQGKEGVTHVADVQHELTFGLHA